MKSHSIQLQTLLQQSSADMETSLALISQGKAVLDCTNVESLAPEQLDLLFDHTPKHWDFADFWPLINIETLTDSFSQQLEQWINQRQGRISQPKKEPKIQMEKTNEVPQDLQNPFSSSHVDTPFQDHVDLMAIHQSEFEQLKYLIKDIRCDKNHQSQGVIVIGEPGSGKTHLMMRLAKDLLQVNRLLFIRHPNNYNSVLYHIYSRILESFVYKIPGTNHTQLEFLLAHSFVKLISHTPHMTLNQKDQYIQQAVKDDPLELYEKLGAEGTQRKMEYWEHIKKRTHDWWTMEYGIGGYAPEIIKGIVKFCSYSQANLKALVTRWLAAGELDEDELKKVGLSNWSDDMSKEAFSLEAISVFSKLSLLDEPLIIIFDQLEILGLDHNKELLISFGEAVKEIFTHVPNSLIILNLFPDRWQQFRQELDPSVVERISQHQVTLKRPENNVLRTILSLKAQSIGQDLDQLFTPSEIETIVNQRSIREVINTASRFYVCKVNGQPIPEPTPSDLTRKGQPNIEERLDKLEQDFHNFKLLVQKVMQARGDSSLIVTVDPQNQESVNLSSKSSEYEFRVKDYLSEQLPQLELEYEEEHIISDDDDLGKLRTILMSIQPFYGFKIDKLLTAYAIPRNLIINTNSHSHMVAFLNESGNTFTNRIKNLNEIVFSHKNEAFLLWRDGRASTIKNKTVGKAEIEKLESSPNGEFRLMYKDDRIKFELLYKLITDIYNKDLDVPLEDAWTIVTQEIPEFWLFKILSN